MALSENARMALLGVGATAAALFLFRGAGSSTSPSDPYRLVPKESFLAATLDAAELRKSPLYEVLLGKDAPLGPMLGAGALTEACGFDPITRVTKLAASVPEEERGEVGLAAKVEVSKEELEKCSKALADKRGGKTETRQVGSFYVLQDGATAGNEHASRIAYGMGGLLVVGKGKWFDTMLATGEHQHPSIDGDAQHTKMRAALTGREGWRAPTLVVTALLPTSLRERLKKDMGAEADGANNIMAGVLGVSAVGVAFKAGAAGSAAELAVELECDTADGCAVVDKLIQRKRLELSKDLAMRMVGFGAVIDSIHTAQEGAHLRVTASADAETLAGTLERAMRFRGGGRGNDDALHAPRVPRPKREGMGGDPGFTVRAPKDDGGAPSGTGSDAGTKRPTSEVHPFLQDER